jgi:putative ABC transport system permease protein
LDAGDQLEVLGETFKVAEVRSEAGTLEDIQLVLNLHDAQRLVDKPGRIHQIMALNCKCKGSRISVIRQQLEGVLPDTKVTEHLSRATAREMQRDAVELQARQQMELVRAQGAKTLAEVQLKRRHGEGTLTTLISVLLPLVVLVVAMMVGLMTWLNVRERRAEIGVLRALGKQTRYIAALFLVKSLLVGVAGGAVACLLAVLAGALADSSLASGGDFSGAWLRPSASLLALTVLGAPCVTMLAGYLPTLFAITQDPARILTEE